MQLINSYTYNDKEYFIKLLNKEDITQEQKDEVLKGLNLTDDDYTIELWRDDKGNVFVYYKLNGQKINKRDIENNFIVSKLSDKIDKWLFEKVKRK